MWWSVVYPHSAFSPAGATRFDAIVSLSSRVHVTLGLWSRRQQWSTKAATPFYPHSILLCLDIKSIANPRNNGEPGWGPPSCTLLWRRNFTSSPAACQASAASSWQKERKELDNGSETSQSDAEGGPQTKGANGQWQKDQD